MSYSYRPRRCGKRWLEGAPSYIMSVHDCGEQRAFDRYTFFYWMPEWPPETDPRAAAQPYLGCSYNPDHPQGFSQHGDTPAHCPRRASGKHIRWLDVPENVRKHVIRRLEEAH